MIVAIEGVVVGEGGATKVSSCQTPVHAQVNGEQHQILSKYVHLQEIKGKDTN